MVPMKGTPFVVHAADKMTSVLYALQVNGYDDPDLGLGVQGSTQTEFHCPRMTLRYEKHAQSST